MLEKNHGMFDNTLCDFHYENGDGYFELSEQIRSYI